MRLRLAVAAAAASLVICIAGCAGSPDSAADPSRTTVEGLGGELTIYAAASLKTAFDEIARDFESANPGVDVLPIVYDGSSTLATQIAGGARPDVFASADELTMTKVADEGLVGDAELFAANTLVIVTPGGNPADVDDLADLADRGVTVVLCAPEVPCGAASATLLSNQKVRVTPASLEQNVSAVLTKVRNDEADAGLVYATDALGQADVESVVPEGAADVVNRYPIAALTDAPNEDAAEAFVAFVLGGEGQAVLAGLGFGKP